MRNKNRLTIKTVSGYPMLVTGIPVAGFDSPISGRTHRHQQFRRFFCVRGTALLLLGGPCGEPSGSPVPTAGLSTRTVPPILRLTAQRAGIFPPKVGVNAMNNAPVTTPSIFQFKHHQVRTITDDQGEPWWVAKDVCSILGHTNPTMALTTLDDDERAKKSLGRQGEANCVNESGLYTLIIRSNKPQAKAFRKWITSEVLPAIRRTGSYAAHPTPEPNLNTALLETTTKMLQVMNRLVDRIDQLEASQAVQPQPVEKPAPKKPLALDYSVRSFTPTTLGNRIGLTGKEFNLLLESEGLQVSVRIHEQKQWRPTLAGESHSILLDIGKSRKSGFHLQQLRWFDSVMSLVAPPAVKKPPIIKPPPSSALLLGLRDLAWSEGMRMRDLAATLIAAGLAKRTKDNVLRPTARAWEHRACVPNSHGNIAWRPEVVSPLIAGRKVAL